MGLGTSRSEFLGHPKSSIFWLHPHSGGILSPTGSERSDGVHELAVGLELGGAELAHGAALELHLVVCRHPRFLPVW